MINKVILVGRITKDPEIRQAGSSETVRFTLACNRRFKTKDGQRQADFITCNAWGVSARFMADYVRKGNLLGVEGSIETGSYDSKQGYRVYTTEIRCDNVQILDSKNDNSQQSFDAPTLETNTQNVKNDFKVEDNFDEEFENSASLDLGSDDLPFY